MDLDENLMKRPPLQKTLSHFGALHITSEVFKATVAAEQLTDFDIWEAEVDGDRYYLATYDPMNHVYAAWLYHVANGLRLTTINIERLGDIVEAGLGLLHLATMYPSNFAEIMPNPNLMWRRIETSIGSRKTWTCPIQLGKRKREKVWARCLPCPMKWLTFKEFRQSLIIGLWSWIQCA
jgi:hypothetical protein